MERLAWLLKREGKVTVAGPAFCHLDGSMLRSYELDVEFHKALKVVQSEQADLIPPGTGINNLYVRLGHYEEGHSLELQKRELQEQIWI
jgi:hypothetical protein